MIDFTYKIKNSNKFRQAALTFQRTGKYCAYPANTTEYFEYWDTERRKCIDGWTASDGDFITGYNYFYLNYCKISRTIWKTKEDRFGVKIKYQETVEEFPDFYDYDYYFFLAAEEAEDLDKHLVVAKSRRKGYSIKMAAMCNRNFFLLPGTKSYIYASSKGFLTGDGTLTKCWDIMSFIDKHTAWAKKRQFVNTTMHKRASYEVKDELGNKREEGYLSEIIGVTLKDNPDSIRGKRAKLIGFEEAGSFSELAAAWEIARPSVEQDGGSIGLMIAFGTGGDERADNIGPLKNMFYNPNSFNCLALPNIWDEAADNTYCGFFVPQHTNMNDRDDNGNRLYMDEDGNTLHDAARKCIYDMRAKRILNARDSVTIDRYIAERAECPMESFMELSGNIFPKKDLQTHLATIRIHKKLQNHKHVGDLNIVDGIPYWTQREGNIGDLMTYKLDKNTKRNGAIVIWEHPSQNPPHGLYIIGVDPYDHDQSGTDSLGSCFVYKRFQEFEEYHDIIVAEYTGRPGSSEEFYENVRMLAMYYNARIMYENMNPGLFTYFINNHCDYLLADQPDILNDVVNSRKTVRRRKGCHMTKEIKLWGEGLIKEWLTEEISPGVLRLTTIFSEPLLEELIAYNNKGNFDRVMSLMQVMIYREQLYKHKVREREEEEKQMRLFDRPIFTDKWFYKEPIDEMIQNNTHNIKTINFNAYS